MEQTTIPDCYILNPFVFEDERGYFVKVYHQDIFFENGLETNFTEEYYTFSRKRILRGLHFQLPPHDHTKLVFCIAGRVLDAVIDLRVGSPAYGKYEMFDLNIENKKIIYIPNGLAHGFYVMSESAILVYKTTTVYSQEHDSGILWNSAGVPWPDKQPIISRRDSEFMTMTDFISPFIFKERKLSMNTMQQDLTNSNF